MFWKSKKLFNILFSTDNEQEKKYIIIGIIIIILKFDYRLLLWITYVPTTLNL